MRDTAIYYANVIASRILQIIVGFITLGIIAAVVGFYAKIVQLAFRIGWNVL